MNKQLDSATIMYWVNEKNRIKKLFDGDLKFDVLGKQKVVVGILVKNIWIFYSL